MIRTAPVSALPAALPRGGWAKDGVFAYACRRSLDRIGTKYSLGVPLRGSTRPIMPLEGPAGIYAVFAGGEDIIAVPPEFSDEALALRFAVQHTSDMRYVAAWGRWSVWDGMRWRYDDTLVA